MFETPILAIFFGQRTNPFAFEMIIPLEVNESEKSPTNGTSIKDLITTNPFLYKLAFSSVKTYFLI